VAVSAEEDALGGRSVGGSGREDAEMDRVTGRRIGGDTTGANIWRLDDEDAMLRVTIS